MIPTPDELKSLKEMNKSILNQLIISEIATVEVTNFPYSLQQRLKQDWEEKGWQVKTESSCRNESFMMVTANG